MPDGLLIGFGNITDETAAMKVFIQAISFNFYALLSVQGIPFKDIMKTATASDHIDHVRTQIPYALTVAVVSTVFYLVIGFFPD